MTASFEIADRLASRILTLPIGPHMGLDQAEWVADRVAAATKA